MVAKLFILAACWNSLSSGSTVGKHDKKLHIIKKVAINKIRDDNIVYSFCSL